MNGGWRATWVIPHNYFEAAGMGCGILAIRTGIPRLHLLYKLILTVAALKRRSTKFSPTNSDYTAGKTKPLQLLIR